MHNVIVVFIALTGNPPKISNFKEKQFHLQTCFPLKSLNISNFKETEFFLSIVPCMKYLCEVNLL